MIGYYELQFRALLHSLSLLNVNIKLNKRNQFLAHEFTLSAVFLLIKKDSENKRKTTPNPQRPEKAYLSQLEDMFISFLVVFTRRVKKINYTAERCASNIYFVPSAFMLA